MEIDNISLIEIFKQEAHTQGLLFEKAVLSLINNPQDISLLDTAMRAAHSLKGAAQILGIKNVSCVAHDIEDCFVSIQKVGATLSKDQLNNLLNIFDVLVRVKDLPSNEIVNWPEDTKLVDRFLSEIHSITQNIKQDVFQLNDERFLSLFQSELKNNVEVLRTLLSEAIVPSSFNEVITRAPHSIKGGANIVGFSSLASLSEKIENWFIDIKNHSRSVDNEGIKLIQKYIQILDAIVDKPPSSLSIFIKIQEPFIQACIQQLDTFLQETQEGKKKISTLENLEDTYGINSVIQISPENLKHMMALSSELLVQLKQFKLLNDSLMNLKKRDLEINNVLEKSLDSLSYDSNIQKLKLFLKEALSKTQERSMQAKKALESFEDLIGKTNLFSENLYKTVTLNCMRPFFECIQDIPRLVHNLSEKLDKKISLEIIGKDTLIDRHLIQGLNKSIKHIIRNACDHGIEDSTKRILLGKEPIGKVCIKAYHNAGTLVVEISDDGAGVNISALRKKLVESNILSEVLAYTYTQDELLDFIFLPQFSTAPLVSDISGRGVGLDIVHDFIEEERGSVRINTELNQGTKFLLHLPIMRSVIKALVVKVGLGFYAFALGSVCQILNIQSQFLKKKKNQSFLKIDEVWIPIIYLGQALDVPFPFHEGTLKVIVLSDMDRKYGVIVDCVEEETNLVVRPLDGRLGKVFCVSAVSITSVGEPVFILDIEDVLDSLNTLLNQKIKRHRVSKPYHKAPSSKEILWVDDSDVILKNGIQWIDKLGYKIQTAKNGKEALAKLKRNSFDLLITDLEMPYVTGEELIKTMHTELNIKDLPFLIISSKEIDYPDLYKGRYLNKNNLEEGVLRESITQILGIAES